MSPFERIKLFNQRCGKVLPKVGSDEYYIALDNQLKLVDEELREVREAIANRDLENLQKEGADLDVVTSGLNMFINGNSGDYLKAIHAVCDENDLKYTPDLELAKASMSKHIDAGTPCGIEEVKETLEGLDSLGEFSWYSVKRIPDNKILKLNNHIKCDLTAFAPQLEV